VQPALAVDEGDTRDVIARDAVEEAISATS